jgi:hypothetical protein
MLFGHMMADRASSHRPDDCVMTSKMAGNATYDRSFKTAGRIS